MLRIILISVGVVTTAIAGYIAKRTLFGASAHDEPPELRIYPPSPPSRRRKQRCSPLDQTVNNGEPDFDSAS